MGFIALRCPSCGAEIELDESRDFAFCTYCGTKMVREKQTIEHNVNIRINHDTGWAVDKLTKDPTVSEAKSDDSFTGSIEKRHTKFKNMSKWKIGLVVFICLCALNIFLICIGTTDLFS
jgi:DNA-directed RNA polymerase subunit RPC12/RpoP